ncbi:MAG: NERD domain-containing protein [Deltaproteobacteria bacterium]|nr:NERD domain-containing protein [Deltaproteobacteria bacterium]
MIIKKRDSKQKEIEELNTLLSLPLPENKRFLIERELRFIKSGDRGENDSAYFIDFHYASSKNWAVIHDLRLAHLDRVAQIDHLLINRFFDVYVLESKNFSYAVKITDNGEFLAEYNNRYVAIESPIEQNKRHMIVLEKVMKQHDIMPTRLGVKIRPTLRPYVMVAPKARVIRPSKNRFDTGMVIKADTLPTTIEKAHARPHLADFTTVSKMSSTDTLKAVATRLAALHKPMKIDYRKRFGIEDAAVTNQISPRSSDVEKQKGFHCSKCKKMITERIVKFCWDNRRRFGGKAYCLECQKTVLK